MTVITNNVMKKVRIIFLMRRLLLPLTFFTVAIVTILSTVSISHVIENMPVIVNMEAVIRFFVFAFAHTEIVVKSALVAGTVFLGFTLKGLIDSIRLSSVFQKI